MALLSVIIPFGLSKERLYLEERVFEKAKHFKSNEDIEFIFVEGYSSKHSELKNFIEKNQHIYLKDSKQKFFSQGRCRNLGASYAHSNVLLFLDADCYLSSQSFDRILKWIKIKNISQNIHALIVLPVVYLNKKANEMLKQYDEKLWDVLIQEDLFMAKNTWVKFFAPSSTSSIIINKHQFLKLGGNDENFIGHGYEDFDLFARVLKACVDFEKMPSNLNYDARNWNFYDFKGFRSWFSLLGYEACFHGIYMYHFWHTEPNQNAYMQNKDKNHKLFYKHLKKLKTHNLKPLQIYKVKDKKVLVLFNDRTYDFRDLSVYMGEFIYKKMNDFFINEEFNSQLLLDFLKEKKITQIFLDASIKNQNTRINLNKFDVIYFQKGILSHSWFFSKNPEERFKPNINLNEKEIKTAQEYFSNLSNEEKKIFLDFLTKFYKNYDLCIVLYHLIYELYSFEYERNFYQIIIDGKKIFMGQKNNKSFYSLKSFVYKPYLYELKSFRPFSFLFKFLGLESISVLISHTKFYRLARKLYFNPKGFFEDCKTKRMKI